MEKIGQNSIKNWLEDDRPREKMLQKGPAALSDAELLAILISSGTRERSALDLAKDILQLAGNNLRELGRLTVQEMQKVKGIGEARGVTLCAALELGRRRQLADGPERLIINDTRKAVNALMPYLQDLNHEVFYVIYLNNSLRVLRQEPLSSGGMTAATVDVRMILKNCLLFNACNIIIAHNHPSGNKTASEADKKLTHQIDAAAKLLEIRLLDHIIIAGSNYLSMRDEGMF